MSESFTPGLVELLVEFLLRLAETLPAGPLSNGAHHLSTMSSDRVLMLNDHF